MTTPQPAGQMQQTTKGWADCLDVAIETEDWSLVEEIRDDVHAAHGAAWSASLSAADRVETDAPTAPPRVQVNWWEADYDERVHQTGWIEAVTDDVATINCDSGPRRVQVPVADLQLGNTWRTPSAPAADRVETAARVLHSRRHRAGYSHVCDACRGDARAVAAALTATEENAR